MHWIAIGLAAIGICALGAALLRHPGVILYDWFVTVRSRKRSASRGRAAARAERPTPHPCPDSAPGGQARADSPKLEAAKKKPSDARMAKRGDAPTLLSWGSP